MIAADVLVGLLTLVAIVSLAWLMLEADGRETGGTEPRAVREAAWRGALLPQS